MKKRLCKILLIAVSLLVIVSLIVVSVGAWFVRRPWPEVSGTLAVSGVAAPVKILRDAWGVPHIYAQNELDLFFAQGYVHAQDRLWQMVFNQHASNGTLSLLVGASAVEDDRYMRQLGMRQASEREWASLSADAQANLDAYSRGVNAYLETHRDRLPVEFTLAGMSPAPWTPVDTLAIGRMMANNLSWNTPYEALRIRLLTKLDKQAVEQLLPPYRPGSLFLPTETYTLSLGIDPLQWATLGPYRQGSYYLWGSNNWVVHGNRTATGLPLLANDTHLPLSMPSFWYENGLHGGRFNAIGFTFPGVPLVVIGHNSRIGWGVTDLPADVEDLYVEKVNDAEHPTQYEFEGQWRDLKITQEMLEIKGSQPVTLTIYSTRHGPILDTTLFQNDRSNGPVKVALRTSLAESKIFESLMQLNLATNWQEFRQALRQWELPCEHFVYADVDGNIGYQAAGKIPVRTPKHQGLMPVPGWTDDYEWQGFVDFDQLYSVLNPPEGYLATGNDRALPENYPQPDVYGLDWTTGIGRAQFIYQVLAENPRVTLQDMRDLQANTYGIGPASIVPYLLKVKPQNDLQARALAQVKAWNLYFEADQTGATVYHVWYWFLVQETLGDELSGGLLERFRAFEWLTLPAMQQLLPDPTNPWFDDSTTPQVETREDIIFRSLAKATDWLSQHYGSAPEQWTWARFHKVTMVHRPFGMIGVPPVEKLFNSRTISARGGEYALNMALFEGGTNFVTGSGVSQRFILDLGDWDNSRAVNSTGQSGQLFHPHREDMLSMWEKAEYHPLLFTLKAVEANAKTILVLVPMQKQ